MAPIRKITPDDVAALNDFLAWRAEAEGHGVERVALSLSFRGSAVLALTVYIHAFGDCRSFPQFTDSPTLAGALRAWLANAPVAAELCREIVEAKRVKIAQLEGELRKCPAVSEVPLGMGIEATVIS